MAYEPTPEALAGRELFARNLRQARENRGLTQESLALKSGMDRSFIADLEAARHSCMADRLFDLAVALEVPASFLLHE